ncbi:hypothetical protein RSAG8_09195, partial [Rhizoctonia solani AG-8 WAC10335]
MVFTALLVSSLIWLASAQWPGTLVPGSLEQSRGRL